MDVDKEEKQGEDEEKKEDEKLIQHLPVQLLLFVQLPSHTQLIEDLLRARQIAFERK